VRSVRQEVREESEYTSLTNAAWSPGGILRHWSATHAYAAELSAGLTMINLNRRENLQVENGARR